MMAVGEFSEVAVSATPSPITDKQQKVVPFCSDRGGASPETKLAAQVIVG